MDINKEREAFENWHIRNMDINSDFEKISEQDSPYMDEHVNNSWLTWQAAKAQAVPEGFAVVPIEITPKQIEAYMKGKIFPASMGEHRKFVERLSKDYTAMIEAQEPAND